MLLIFIIPYHHILLICEDYVILRRGVDSPSGIRNQVQIVYDYNISGEWEFTVFPDVRGNCGPLLPCDDQESCKFGFSISAEDAAILIDEALALGLNLAPSTNTNKSSTSTNRPIRLSNK